MPILTAETKEGIEWRRREARTWRGSVVVELGAGREAERGSTVAKLVAWREAERGSTKRTGVEL